MTTMVQPGSDRLTRRGVLAASGLMNIGDARGVEYDGRVDRESDVDASLARAILRAIEQHFWGEEIDGRLTPRPAQVGVSVSHGWVTLHGVVDWRCQRTAVEQVVRDVPGVRGLTDLIEARMPTREGDLCHCRDCGDRLEVAGGEDGSRIVRCSCGAKLSGRDDEELFSLIRGHVDRLHPETHRPYRPVPEI